MEIGKFTKQGRDAVKSDYYNGKVVVQSREEMDESDWEGKITGEIDVEKIYYACTGDFTERLPKRWYGGYVI